MRLRSRQALVACLEFSGMSERELARTADLGHATVNHLITGRRSACSLRTARVIEGVLACGPGTLFAPESETERIELERLLGYDSEGGR